MKLTKDLLTGEEFTPTRKNQKFSSSRNRIAYHNKKANQESNSRAYISTQLINNHRILMNLIQESETKNTFKRDFLEGKGYNFLVMTHLEAIDNVNYPAIFNFICLDLFENNNTLTFFRKQ